MSGLQKQCANLQDKLLKIMKSGVVGANNNRQQAQNGSSSSNVFHRRQIWNQQQPTSLPPELIAASKADLDRLSAELRRNADADYSRLEAARIEAVQHQQQQQPFQCLRHRMQNGGSGGGSGSVSLDASFRFTNSGPESSVTSVIGGGGGVAADVEPTSNAAAITASPSSASSSSSTSAHASNALFSLARAYKVIPIVATPKARPERILRNVF